MGLLFFREGVMSIIYVAIEKTKQRLAYANETVEGLLSELGRDNENLADYSFFKVDTENQLKLKLE